MQEFSLFFTKQTKYSKNVFNVLVNKIRNLIWIAFLTADNLSYSQIQRYSTRYSFYPLTVDPAKWIEKCNLNSEKVPITPITLSGKFRIVYYSQVQNNASFCVGWNSHVTFMQRMPSNTWWVLNIAFISLWTRLRKASEKSNYWVTNVLLLKIFDWVAAMSWLDVMTASSSVCFVICKNDGGRISLPNYF